MTFFNITQNLFKLQANTKVKQMEWLKIKNLIVLKNKLLINNYILKIKLKLGTLFNYEKCFTRYIKRLTGSNVANYGV